MQQPAQLLYKMVVSFDRGRPHTAAAELLFWVQMHAQYASLWENCCCCVALHKVAKLQTQTTSPALTSLDAPCPSFLAGMASTKSMWCVTG
jgi:hypothetical protein